MSLSSDSPRHRMAHVGRQPIYGRGEGLVGYELLYRSGQANHADFTDGDQASLTVMLTAMVDIGLSTLTNGRTAFINLTRNGVLCEFPRLFPRDKVVFEVLEDVTCDDDVMLALQRMAADGHVFALDDFVEHESNTKLIEFVRYLKLDIQNMSPENFAHHARKYASFQLIAEKVETKEQHQLCQDLGIGAYQGYWFSKPAVLSCSVPVVSRTTVLSLLYLLKGRQIVDVSAAANVLATDPALLLRVLRAIPEPPKGGVATLGEAIHALGSERLAAICTLLALATGEEEPAPEPPGALARARLCEILGDHHSRAEGCEAHFAGLLLAAAPTDARQRLELWQELPLAPGIKAALLHHEGRVGAILKAVLEFESGAADAATKPALDQLFADAHQRVRRARDLLLA